MSKLSPAELLDAFARAVERLERYRIHRKLQGKPRYGEAFATEAQIRVYQALYALARFRAIELKPEQREPPECVELSPFAAGVLTRDMGAPELEFYAESFYLVAFRARLVLRKLPELKSFETPGVRDVRNWLIQHAEGKHGRMGRHYAWDGPVGFRIKSFGSEDTMGDRGLYPNASEFVTTLNASLDRLLAEPAYKLVE